MNDQERVTVREYIEALLGNCKDSCRDKFVNIYETMQILFENQDEKLKIAKIEMDRRLEQMNEVRSQLERQAREFTIKGEQVLINNQIFDRLAKVEEKKSLISGNMIVIMAIISAIITGLFVVGIKILGK